MRLTLVLLVFLLPLGSFAQALQPDTLQFSDSTALAAPKKTWSTKKRGLILGAAGAVVTAGVGIAAYQWFDEPIQDFSQSNRNFVTKGIAKAVEPFGTPVPLHTTFAALLTAGIVTKRPKLREAAAVSLASFYVNALVTQQLKQTFQRYRPSSSLENDNFDGPEGGGKNGSLPSSHTSNAFAAATAIATVYRDKRWVPPVAYGVATLVGLSRIHDNAHWTSDVVAGAALGYLSAKASYWGYQRARTFIKGRQWRVVPGWFNNSPLVTASLQF